jgi:hypothetical protein
VYSKRCLTGVHVALKHHGPFTTSPLTQVLRDPDLRAKYDAQLQLESLRATVMYHDELTLDDMDEASGPLCCTQHVPLCSQHSPALLAGRAY